MDLVEEIHKQYGVELPVAHGTFDEAKREAQRSAMYLLVYLHCPTHENTHVFLKEVLSSSLLYDLLRNRFVFFVASVMEPAGYRLSLEMQANTFPFLAVLMKRTTVMKVKGLITADRLLQQFQNIFDCWDGVLAEDVHLRHEREEKERMRREEDQRTNTMQSIDRERIRLYEEKVLSRYKRVRQRLSESEAMVRQKLEETEVEQRRKLEMTMRFIRADVLRTEALMRLPAEPPADADISTVACISLKSLQGTQHRRRFSRRDRLCSLWDYAVTLDGYDGSLFQLVAGYPPRVMERDESKTVGDVPDLLPRAVVLMRRV